MKTIKVIKVLDGMADDTVSEIDKGFFSDMIFQAMFYPGSSVTIGNRTLSGKTLFIKRSNQPVAKKYYGDLKKAVAYLWGKALEVDSIVFRSKFEQVEYLVQH